MTTEKTIEKAEKLSGEKIQKDSNGMYSVNYKGYQISFYANGGGEDSLQNEAICFYTLKNGRKDNLKEDYYAGTFHDNLTKCFKFVDRITHRFRLVA